MGSPEEAARVVLEQVRAELELLGEPMDNYVVDVELIGSVLYGLGIQRVPELRVGARSYAALLNGDARLIAVEANHHMHRQRFSIAHEIGHFTLHYQPGRPQSSLFKCSAADMRADAGTTLHLRREWEANLFAGELLMPEPAIIAMYRVTGGRKIAMARHFRVSLQAMEIRLSRMALPF